MKILIADSGATKTDWCLLLTDGSQSDPSKASEATSVQSKASYPARIAKAHQPTRRYHRTGGMNPLHLDQSTGRRILDEVRAFVGETERKYGADFDTGADFTEGANVTDSAGTTPATPAAPATSPQTSRLDAVYFYGAGCVDEKAKSFIKDLILEVFPDTPIHIATDIDGVARAAFNSERSGLLIVLGTGTIVANILNGKVDWRFHALGYLLGDEGSSVALGKALYRAWYRSPETSQIHSEIKERGGFPPYGEAMQEIYSNERPAAILTQLAARILKPPLGPALTALVEEEFNHLLASLDKAHSLREKKNVVVSGGLVSHHHEILLKCLNKWIPGGNVSVMDSVIDSLSIGIYSEIETGENRATRE